VTLTLVHVVVGIGLPL